MSIWDYREYRREPFAFADPRTRRPQFNEDLVKAIRSDTFLNSCPYCDVALSDLHAAHINQDWWLKEVENESDSCHQIDQRIAICGACGWHSVTVVKQYKGLSELDYELLAASASLREFSLTDLSEPLDEVRSYLQLKYDSRLTMSPKLFEEVVASVFRDLGYSAVVASASTDEGIDIVLSKGSDTIGVQVKRYQNAIEAEQIRSLTGALTLRGLNQGIFVTTSRYRSGAVETARRFRYRGFPIELVDAERFFEMLNIARRPLAMRLEEYDRLQLLNKVESLVRFHHFTGHGISQAGEMRLEMKFSELFDSKA